MLEIKKGSQKAVLSPRQEPVWNSDKRISSDEPQLLMVLCSEACGEDRETL